MEKPGLHPRYPSGRRPASRQAWISRASDGLPSNANKKREGNMADTSHIASGLRRATESGDIPGVVAAAANADGVLYQGAFGTRDLATGAPMTTDTVVWIASMTKAVTGACAMQLVEQGKLSLDGDIAAILPELGRVQVLQGFDADGKPRLRPPKRAITLRHLLTHTAGFAYDMWNPDVGRYMDVTGTPSIVTC